MQDDFNISRRKTLAALGTIGAASAGAGLGTSAYFSDQESFENNRLVAGELDLKVSWDEHYSDWMGEETDYARMPEDGEIPDLSLPAADPNGRPIELVFSDRTAFMDATRQEQFPPGGLGSEEGPCEALADVGDDDMEAPVITIDDVKPGDFGEVTFDFAACDNPALLWMNGRLVDEAENGLTEPEADDPDEDGAQASLWPLALLGAVPALGGGDDGDASVETETEADTTTPDDPSDRRSALRKGAAAAGAGTAGLAAASKAASATDSKRSEGPTDPDGPYDINISNSSLDVNVGELGSGTTVQGTNWDFNGVGTLYRETYGFRDGTGSLANAEQDGSLDTPFPGSVSAGTTAESTITIPVQTSGGTTVTLEVDRNVTLDPNEATLRVEYEVTNPSGSGATFDDLRISQYVDYDIDAPGGEVGEYYLDTTTECEFIFQEDEGLGLFAGFTGEDLSVNHDLDFWSTTLSRWRNGGYNNDDQYPDSGTGDVGLAFEWSLGELAPGETTSFRNSFVYNENESDFETEICQESPGTPTPEPPTQGGPELADKLRARAWYDDGDNVHQDDEDVFIEGSLREVLNALSAGNGVPLGGNEPAPQGGGADTSRDCYSESPDVHYVAFQWWLPIDHGNEVQGDSVTFDLGFYTEQCRHNDGSGMNNDGVDDDEVDP
ncbi:SipW-dependent-type signal peptide-containing protein [Haloplanus aerogenes]|uniref:SipW-dependent-type signal peptide-containing protein n=1 Tax=Haloplanus aerogenes TaxID=660522 RepID=UPI001FB654C5|nr:SipW-dependent-type signal peptide-containing protein [Haloplanus aerogenes]